MQVARLVSQSTFGFLMKKVEHLTFTILIANPPPNLRNIPFNTLAKYDCIHFSSRL